MLILPVTDIRLAACFVLVNQMDKNGMFCLQAWAIKTVLNSALSFFFCRDAGSRVGTTDGRGYLAETEPTHDGHAHEREEETNLQLWATLLLAPLLLKHNPEDVGGNMWPVSAIWKSHWANALTISIKDKAQDYIISLQLLYIHCTEVGWRK